MNAVAPTRRSSDLIVVAAVCAALLGLVFFAQTQGRQQLRQSPAGFAGLKHWLSSEGVSTQTFAGGWLLDPESVGLLVLPLYDTKLDSQRKLPETKEELLLQPDEFDLSANVIREKVETVPTLVVLPKWRSGMRLTRIAHPMLLVPGKSLQREISALTTAQVTLGRARQPTTRLPYANTGLTAELYAAQTLNGSGCNPIIGTAERMVLADCPAETGRVLILSDPDLLNNHGLRLGDNATIAREFISDLAGEKNVIIDYSRDVWFQRDDVEPTYERSWSDLLQFFAPPFLTLWVGAAAVLALTLWRGAIRGAPIAAGPTPSASKSQAVAARARLMRLSDQDGALIQDYAKARIATVAGQLFGPAHARSYASPDAFAGYLSRRQSPHAEALADVLDTIADLPARTTAAQAISHVDALEQVLEQITHDT